MSKYVRNKEPVKDKREWTQVEIQEIWFKHKRCFLEWPNTERRAALGSWVGLENLQKSLPSSTMQVLEQETSSPGLAFLHISAHSWAHLTCAELPI